MNNMETVVNIQLQSGLSSRPDVGELDVKLFPNRLETGDVIEVNGEDGCGKTQVLLHLTANCLLPRIWKQQTMGGLEASILFIDTDYRFSLIRLASIIQHRFQNIFPTAPETEVELFLRDCLSRLHVAHCNSSMQLLITLCSMETFIGSKPTISGIFIDSLSSFYWQDRGSGVDGSSLQDINQQKITDQLHKLLNMHGLILIASVSVFFNRASHVGNLTPYNQEIMCKSWQKLVKYRLRLKKSEESTFEISAAHINSKIFQITEGGICITE